MDGKWSPYDPGKAPGDVIYQNNEVHLAWPDRLRVLLGRAIRVSTELETEHPVGASRQRPTVTRIVRRSPR